MLGTDLLYEYCACDQGPTLWDCSWFLSGSLAASEALVEFSLGTRYTPQLNQTAGSNMHMQEYACRKVSELWHMLLCPAIREEQLIAKESTKQGGATPFGSSERVGRSN